MVSRRGFKTSYVSGGGLRRMWISSARRAWPTREYSSGYKQGHISPRSGCRRDGPDVERQGRAGAIVPAVFYLDDGTTVTGANFWRVAAAAQEIYVW